MGEKTCNVCGKHFLLSNMITGSTCFSCYRKTLSIQKKMLHVSKIISPVFPFTPIIAGILSMLFIFFVPSKGQLGLAFFITNISMFLICLIGMISQIQPFLKEDIIEIEQNYKLSLDRLIPGKISFCLNHPESEAIGRCSYCFEPFCHEDFYFLFRKPTFCHGCGEKYLEVEIYPTITLPLTMGVLFFAEFFTSGLNIISLITFIGSLVIPPVFAYIKYRVQKQSEMEYYNQFLLQK
ncbi:MAG: hypothetical protein HWN65_18620 [Candidatus Helarchaeota archaeon]|nr:hypothetical protein [Candidatus Helarchaeota archaeon]